MPDLKGLTIEEVDYIYREGVKIWKIKELMGKRVGGVQEGQEVGMRYLK